jgi:hypothetical protein
VSLRGKDVPIADLLSDRVLDQVLDELTERAGLERGTDALNLARWDLKGALVDALDIDTSHARTGGAEAEQAAAEASSGDPAAAQTALAADEEGHSRQGAAGQGNAAPAPDTASTRLVHPSGGAVVCHWPMDAQRAGRLLATLAKLGFDFDGNGGPR